MNGNYGGGSNSRPDYIRSFLKKPPLILKDFHQEDILEFLNMGKKREFYEGQAVSEASSYMKFSYLIVDGKIGIWKNNIQLVTYGSRTFLGETFLFGKNFQSVRLVSANKSTLLRFSRSATLKFFRKKPEKLFNIFTRNIIRTQQNKLGQLTTQMYRFKKRLLDNPPPR